MGKTVTGAGATPVTLATTLAGEDQANSLFRVEQQYGWDEFNRSSETSDYTLGTTGAAGDFLHKVIVTATLTNSSLNIYAGDVSTGTLVLSIPSSASLGTIYELNILSGDANGFVCEDDGNAGTVICVGRFT